MENDQTHKKDAGKIRYTLIPQGTLKAMAQVLTYGESKYPENGWREVPPVRHLDSFFRHLQAYRDGERIDHESGIPHLDLALVEFSFYRELSA